MEFYFGFSLGPVDFFFVSHALNHQMVSLWTVLRHPTLLPDLSVEQLRFPSRTFFLVLLFDNMECWLYAFVTFVIGYRCFIFSEGKSRIVCE